MIVYTIVYTYHSDIGFKDGYLDIQIEMQVINRPLHSVVELFQISKHLIAIVIVIVIDIVIE